MAARPTTETQLPADLRAALSRLARGAHGGLITVNEAVALLGRSPSATATWLARLARRGWLARARRGLYVVLPLEATASRSPSVEDPWVLASKLFSPCYIGGWSAAEHWGLTEQLFRSTFVVTAAGVRRRTERVLGLEFHVVKVARVRLTTMTLVWRGRERVPVSDRERTLADALASPGWVGGIRHLADLLRAYRESRHWNPTRLLNRVNELGRGAAFKRLGFLAEMLLPGAEQVVGVCLAKRTAGIIKLDPSVSTRGRLNKRWGLWVNIPLHERAGP